MIDEKGIYRIGALGLTAEQAFPLLRFPVKSGDTWTQKIKIGGTEGEGTATVKGISKVEVPAGKYEAVEVVSTYVQGEQKIGFTIWYADGVGIVKQITKVGDREVTMELKKFTEGK